MKRKVDFDLAHVSIVLYAFQLLDVEVRHAMLSCPSKNNALKIKMRELLRHIETQRKVSFSR